MSYRWHFGHLDDIYENYVFLKKQPSCVEYKLKISILSRRTFSILTLKIRQKMADPNAILLSRSILKRGVWFSLAPETYSVFLTLISQISKKGKSDDADNFITFGRIERSKNGTFLLKLVNISKNKGLYDLWKKVYIFYFFKILIITVFRIL